MSKRDKQGERIKMEATLPTDVTQCHPCFCGILSYLFTILPFLLFPFSLLVVVCLKNKTHRFLLVNFLLSVRVRAKEKRAEAGIPS